MRIQEHVPLAPMTTLRVGGPARYFVEATTVDEVREAVAYSRSRNLPLLALGGGSNVVISDAGWPGLVLRLGILGINHVHGHHQAIFQAGAGEDWDGFVGIVVAHHCSGVECLSGIPGTVGGTPVQNVGAYGQEAANTIETVTALDLENGEICELSKDDCGFKYRTSIFNTTARGRYIIVQVSFALQHGGAPQLEYDDLKKFFQGRTAAPTLSEVRQAVLQIRASKGMLITPDDKDARSVGSFFKNPVLSASEHEALVHRAGEKGLKVPTYPALDARHKVSAAWLVEHSGFHKGFTRGRVGISSKHALAIVNRGGASAFEIVEFSRDIQECVEQNWRVRLQPEPMLIGFDPV